MNRGEVSLTTNSAPIFVKSLYVSVGLGRYQSFETVFDAAGLIPGADWLSKRNRVKRVASS